MQKIAACEEKILGAKGVRVIGHGVFLYANIKPGTGAILAPTSPGKRARLDHYRGPISRGPCFAEQALPVAIDRFRVWLHAIGDDDMAAGPPQHFKKRALARRPADLRVDHLTACKEDAAAFIPSLDPHRPRGHDAALHLDQVGERCAAGDSGESGRFVCGS